MTSTGLISPVQENVPPESPRAIPPAITNCAGLQEHTRPLSESQRHECHTAEPAVLQLDETGRVTDFQRLELAGVLLARAPRLGVLVSDVFHPEPAELINNLCQEQTLCLRSHASRLCPDPQFAGSGSHWYHLTVRDSGHGGHHLLIRRLTAQEIVQTACRQQHEISFGLSVLTRRELQVFGLVAQGMANKVVARRLQLSSKTIEKHRARVMRKLAVATISDLYHLWFRLTWDGYSPEPCAPHERLGRPA